jgi:hypothetical protein
MDINEASTVYKAIRKTSLVLLADDLVKAAIQYARFRTDWAVATVEGRKDMDTARSRAHEALIDACNILSRNMAKIGEDNRWRVVLGADRKEIGDFACYLHCLLGLQAR